MKYIWFLALTLSLVACKKKGTELTAEQKEAKLQTQLDSIANIKFEEVVKEEVDTYPLFKGVCDTATTKQTQKECFEKTFVAKFQESLKKASYQVTEPVTDSIVLNVKVDNTGKVVLVDMQADEHTKELLTTESESFEDSLRANLSALSESDAITPATKNGQNVSTQFRLPVQINVK
jgi:hypothetical protein